MRDAIRKYRVDVSLGGILVILLGIMLVIDADFILLTMGWLVGLILAVVGVTQFVGKLFAEESRSSGMLVGGLIAIIGIWIMIQPEFVAGFFPMLIGVVLVVHGIQGMSMAFAARKAKMKKWWSVLFGGITDVIAGVFCVGYSFAVGVIAMQVIGLLLIYDGVITLISANRVNYYEKQQVIDAGYRAVEDEAPQADESDTAVSAHDASDDGAGDTYTVVNDDEAQ